MDRIGELKTLSADPTKNSSDVANYDTEFSALQAQLTALGSQSFNGINLFGTNALNVNTTEDATSSVALDGIDMLPTPAFSPFSENFSDLSQWTDDSLFGGSAYVSGNELNLDSSFGIVTSSQSFSGPFEVNLEYQAKSIGDIFVVRLGNNGTIIGGVSEGDTNWHTMKIVFDGATSNAYRDGSASPTTTDTPSPNFGPLQLLSNASVGVRVRNLSVTSGGGSSSGNVSTVTGAANLDSLSLTSIKDSISDVATYRAKYGAEQSRLGFASELLSVNKANLEAANSRIVDVDVAQESTVLARANILVQAGTSMLSQANQSPQMALRLLQ